jgi:hypothetical protein
MENPESWIGTPGGDDPSPAENRDDRDHRLGRFELRRPQVQRHAPKHDHNP